MANSNTATIRRRLAFAKRSRTGGTIDLKGMAKRLAEVREAQDIPPTRLDMLAGVSRGMTTRIEHCDRPELTVSVLARLVDHLNTSLDYIVFGEEEDAPHQGTEYEGHDIPAVSFLNKAQRLPGLMSFLESADGVHLPLRIVAAGLRRLETAPPKLDAKGTPTVGWKDFFARIGDREKT